MKLFITHGGMMGMQEAYYCGIPTLGIPIFADQFLNIKQAEAKGLSIQLFYDDITKEAVLNALNNLMKHSK